MSAALTSVLSPVYTCQICRRTLSLNGPVIVGETHEARMARISQVLADHLGQNHKEQMIEIMMIANGFAGFLMWQQYQHTNQDLVKQSELMRSKIRSFTKRVHVPDQKIEQQIARWSPPGDEEQLRQEVIALLKGLRDSLDEVQPPQSK